MLLLGLLLLAATTAFVVLLIADNLTGLPKYQVEILGNEIATMDVLQIFSAGLVLGLLFCLGLWMVMRSARRQRRTSSRLSEARRAEAERDELAEQLARERGTQSGGPEPAPGQSTAGRHRGGKHLLRR